MCLVTKRDFIKIVFVITILLTCCHYSFVGSCLVSAVFSSYSPLKKEQISNHKVVAEQVVIEGEDLVVYKILLSWYCSKFNNTDAE